jgi:bacillithiol biosynthesis deacetylase BshB1
LNPDEDANSSHRSQSLPGEPQASTSRLDVLAFGAHPDDAELGCGALLARLAQAGQAVGICHLTHGENGTRGTAAVRREEAAEAARHLGATLVEHLDCGDGELRTGTAEEEAVIEILRRTRPTLVLAPPPRDRHPDHERAHRLVLDACFYAGLAKRASHLGPPHRPATLFWYMLHQTFEPALLIDVSSVWTRKMAALEAYASQFAGRHSTSNEHAPPTHISSSSFWAAIEGRARHYGQQIGVEFAEPLACRLPIALHDPVLLLAARRP